MYHIFYNKLPMWHLVTPSLSLPHPIKLILSLHKYIYIFIVVLGSFINESCASGVVATSFINLKIDMLSFKYVSCDTGIIFEAMVLVFSHKSAVYGH